MSHSNGNSYYFRDEILIIDDQDQRKEIKNFLEEEGFLVEWKVNWKEVHELLEERRQNGLPLPDIALVDLYIPNSGVTEDPQKAGIKIIEKINSWCNHEKKPPIPCIAYTGNVPEPELNEIYSAGAVSFISKIDFDNKETRYARLKAVIKDANLGFPLEPRNVA
jgi:CheY-like chemotaxis protein